MITTTLGERDESTLLKYQTVRETDEQRVTTVEYCLADCDGPAHRTGQPDAPSHRCNKHVHRSVAVVIKKGLLAHGSAGSFG